MSILHVLLMLFGLQGGFVLPNNDSPPTDVVVDTNQPPPTPTPQPGPKPPKGKPNPPDPPKIIQETSWGNLKRQWQR